MNTNEAMVISKLLNEEKQAYEYWIKLPDRSTKSVLLKTGILEVGDKLAIKIEGNSFKILNII